MKRLVWHAATTLSSLLTLLALVVLTLQSRPELPIGTWVVFTGLILFSNIFYLRTSRGTISLMPVMNITAVLVMGVVLTGWSTYIAALLQILVRQFFVERLDQEREPFANYIVYGQENAVIYTISTLLAGSVYQRLGGRIPFAYLDLEHVPKLLALCLIYLVSGLILRAFLLILESKEIYLKYKESVPAMFLFGLLPTIYAPVSALIFARDGLLAFLPFTSAMVIFIFTLRALFMARNRLVLRINELNSLQAVSQALSSTLELDKTLHSIYEEVIKLIPADGLYISLYDPQTNEVSFPLMFRAGQEMSWKSRQFKNGLTEYILRTKKPLLVPHRFLETIRDLGISPIGHEPKSWLGVPLTAGNLVIGVLAIHTYKEEKSYTGHDVELLETIAGQAALAIENARLYALTDQALNQRVQELDSVFRTTNDGLLLLDPELKIAAVNTAFSDITGTTPAELIGRPLDDTLLASSGIDREGLSKEIHTLTSREEDEVIVRMNLGDRCFERRLAPVYASSTTGIDEPVTGWLLVLRDINEEVKLAQLKDEMTYMLVHDLRSPLSTLSSSLHMLEHSVSGGDQDAADFISLSLRSTNRMLGMVNTLLQINQLEEKEIPISLELVDFGLLLEDLVEQMQPAARDLGIELTTSIQPTLPVTSADRSLMTRVLINLLDNGIKFTQPGGHVNAAAAGDPDQPGESILLSVQDDGMGIPPELQERIFEKYARLHPDKRRAGTGLGLPFCKLAVEAHHGSLWVESEPGKGSKFVLRLPVHV
jgi:PAS domain S-box-containing protein